ncbi:MAG: hypothetical protein ACJAXZ_003582, partial [Akkermansiaceae bacterium]
PNEENAHDIKTLSFFNGPFPSGVAAVKSKTFDYRYLPSAATTAGEQ